jgi:hypothetical protein
MNEEHNQDSDPYDFEPEAIGKGRLRAIWITTAAIVVAGGLVAGTAFALNKPATPTASNSPVEKDVPVPSYPNEPKEAGEHFDNQDQHTVVIPPVAVKPRHKPKPAATSVSSPLPSFSKKPHHEHEHEGDDENEGSDD